MLMGKPLPLLDRARLLLWREDLPVKGTAANSKDLLMSIANKGFKCSVIG